MDSKEIQHIFQFLHPSLYFDLFIINKKYTQSILERAVIKITNNTSLRLTTVDEIQVYSKVPIESLPDATKSLKIKTVFPSTFVVKLLQKYHLGTLHLEHIDCNTMAEYKHIHQLLGVQTQLVSLKYASPPTDISLMYLSSLNNITHLSIRLIPRIIPIITKMLAVRSLSIQLGAQSIAKITEDNNNINPFKSLSTLIGMTSLRISADSIKQLNSLSSLTNLKSLKVIDMLDMNISNSTKLVFLTKLRNLQNVYLHVKQPVTTPDILANYLKMPKIFSIRFASFEHDFEKSKSYDSLIKVCESAHCTGNIIHSEFYRNTCQLDRPLSLLNKCCPGGFETLSLTSTPNISNAYFDTADLSYLRALTINQCLKVKSLEFLKKCSCITSLELSKIPPTELTTISLLTNILEFGLGMVKIENIKFVESLTSLKSLKLSSLTSLTDMSPVNSLHHLTKLYINKCDVLVADVSDCPLVQLELVNVPASNSLVYVNLFGITGCDKLKNLHINKIAAFDKNIENTITDALPNLSIHLN
ncbi:Leucine-rich repeat containing protein [Entamoeba marina]